MTRFAAAPLAAILTTAVFAFGLTLFGARWPSGTSCLPRPGATTFGHLRDAQQATKDDRSRTLRLLATANAIPKPGLSSCLDRQMIGDLLLD